MVLRAGGAGRTIKILATTAGVALMAGLGSGDLAARASSRGDLISGISRGSGLKATSDSVVYARLEDGPAPSTTDLSTLKIAGTIDPATVEITEFDTPRSVDSLAVSPTGQ
jgi:hypothetical protein